eukprot:CAMPEP_0201908026 /NCGR_PEP_ID=MMETSP0903-20130614/228_1 /ASSEMBLY_ACC=CAM_ASM_000552 /TAXON_ID=420261 /ORGANISM="Thalassiosira antarctica, Strain CCMP982" /LENGTH=390 /DNA_ID=CAMNT_0048442263 /DNA_START=40 /DNA_END=1212 /DNA_ORIENTATION=-
MLVLRNPSLIIIASRLWSASSFPSRISHFGGRTNNITRTTTLNMSTDKHDNTNLRSGKDGSYQRHDSKHRHFISASETSAGTAKYPVEADRYHLHVALACPWACGALGMIKLKGLDEVISHSIVHPTWVKTKLDDDSDAHCGWAYRSPGDEPLPNTLGHGSNVCDDALKPDTFTNAASIRDLYAIAGDFDGPYTTPVLWDKKTNTIVSNESTEILKMLNKEFNSLSKNPDLDLYPAEFQEEMQELNDKLVYPKVNNGVYRCGFAKSQTAYNQAVTELFESLEFLEERLSKQRYLAGSTITWLDFRLFMTLVRFDPVYVTYFKTNLKRIADYPNLLGYVREIYSIPAMKEVINIDHIKAHYFTSHPHLNTFGIIPVLNGPDLNVPHGRENM